MLAHHLDGVLWEGGGIGVVEPYPVGSGLCGKLMKEVAEASLSIEVEAVVGGVLRYDDELLSAVGYEFLGFGDNLFDGARDVPAADVGDGTIGAATVASFGYFDVGVVGGGAHLAQLGEVYTRFVARGAGFVAADVVDEVFPFMHAIPGIHFGDFLLQFFAVALDETSCGNQDSLAPVVAMALVEPFLGCGLFEEDIDGFLLSVANESAGVDDDTVAVVAATIEMHLVVCRKMTGKVFGVDGVLRTAERYDVYFQCG